MNFTSFKYFLVVAQELNITRASKRLFITQQSLSERIRKLEDYYGIELFQRTPRLKLTYAGELMVDFAKEILNIEARINNAVSDITDKHLGTLFIGIRPSHSKILIPSILPIFSEEYPYVNLRFAILPSNEITQLLLSNQLDLGLISPRFANNSRFISLKIQTDYYCMVIPENIMHDCLYISRDDYNKGLMPDPNILKEIPFLMTKPGGATREVADEFLLSQNITKPNILSETTGYDFETNFTMSAEGIGITFGFGLFYNYFTKNYPQKYKLYKFPIKTKNTNPDMMISYQKNSSLSQAGKDFISITREIASKL